MHDAFCSYDSRDHPSAQRIAAALRARDIDVFFDRWSLTPGRPWQEELEEALGECRTAMILIGPNEMGSWQKRERWLALDRQAHDDSFLVIPVLIPGADESAGFLSNNTWVDFRRGLEDGEALEKLVWAIRGELDPATAPEPLPALCPFRGLRAFREEDADYFFGRESFTNELFDSLASEPLIGVIGASGSGKSSVVRAGLLPRLRASRDPVWEIVVLVPGDDPLRSLAAALLPVLEPSMTEVERLDEIVALRSRLADGAVRVSDVVRRILDRQPGTDRVLIVADQWEELYTLCHDRNALRRFVDGILDGTEAGAFHVVFTLRADFYAELVKYRPMADRLHRSVRNLGPMTRSELEDAVRKPALRAGLVFEPGLSDKLIDVVEREPANLPLLEFVLERLWEERRGNLLHHDAYEAMGELEGAIARRAEEVYAGLDGDGRALLRSAFLRLVRTSDDAPDTRRRASAREMDAKAMPIVEKLAAARLIVAGRDDSGQPTFEIGHEALIHHWDRLDRWIREDRDFLRFRDRLQRALSEWRSHAYAQGELIGGSLLDAGRKWSSSRPADLTKSEREFIARSDRYFRRQRLGKRAAALGAIAIALLLPAAGYLVWRVDRREARVRADRLVKRASDAVDPLIGALLLAEIDADVEPSAGAFTARRILDGHVPYARIPAHSGEIRAIVWSPDGRFATAGNGDPVVRVWRADGTGDPIPLPGHTAGITAIAIDAAGESFASGDARGVVRLWSAAGTAVWTIDQHDRRVSALAFSADGRRLLSASWDATVALHSIVDGTSSLLPGTDGGAVLSAAFSPDGAWVVAGSDDGSLRLWTAAGGDPLVRSVHDAGITFLRFSPNGSYLLAGSRDGVASFWSMPDFQVVRTLGGGREITDAAFSRDERRLAIATGGREVVVFDMMTTDSIGLPHASATTTVDIAADGRIVLTGGARSSATLWSLDPRLAPRATPLEGLDGNVTRVRFGPAGDRFATGSESGEIRLWRTGGSADPVALVHGTEPVRSAAFLGDGSRVISAGDDGRACIWSPPDLEHCDMDPGAGSISAIAADAAGEVIALRAFRGTSVWRRDGIPLDTLSHQGDTAVAIDPSGTVVVLAGADRVVRMWRRAETREPRVLGKHNDAITSLALSPDGSTVLAGARDGTVMRWQTDGERPGEPIIRHSGPVSVVRFDARGEWIITAGQDSTAVIWRPGTTDSLRLEGHAGAVLDAAFDRQGRRVATASRDGTIRIWPTDGSAGFLTLPGRNAAIETVDFSPDGQRIASVSLDSTVLVRASDGTGEAIVLRATASRFESARFSPDGRQVVTAGTDGVVRIWNVTWPALAGHIRTFMTACLTDTERRQYLDEDERTARRRAAACESGHGRTVPVDATPNDGGPT